MTKEREQELVEMVGRRYEGAKVSIVEVSKPDGMKRGIQILEKGNCVAPVIYFSAFEDLSTEEMADKIVTINEENRVTNFDMNWYRDFDKVKSLVKMRLVNTKWSEKYLEGKTSIPLNDLSILFCVKVNDPRLGGNAWVTVTEEHRKQWGVTLEQLDEAARANMNEPVLKGMFSTLMELSPIAGVTLPDDEIHEEMDNDMMVLSNREKVNGAGYLPVMLDRLAERFGEFFVLPSSQHEVLIVPKKVADERGMTKEVLDEMVRGITQFEVDPSERLSDHAYHFVNGELLD